MPLKLYATYDDAALLEALRIGNALAFEEIYRRYWLRLFNAALRKLGSREAAEEIVQDLFTALWHKRTVHTIEKLPGYLTTALKYRIIDHLRSRMAHQDYLLYRDGRQSELDYNTEEVLAASDLSVALAASVVGLPKSTQEVFRLSRFEHQSVPEIAGRLNLSPKTVEYHLTRALKMLRVSLKDFLLLAGGLFNLLRDWL